MLESDSEPAFPARRSGFLLPATWPRLQARRKWLAEMKRRHMAHPFHDETGNFGIATMVAER